jgi:hypothetical protein
MKAQPSKKRAVKAAKKASAGVSLWNVTPSARAQKFIKQFNTPAKARKFLKDAGMPAPKEEAA